MPGTDSQYFLWIMDSYEYNRITSVLRCNKMPSEAHETLAATLSYVITTKIMDLGKLPAPVGPIMQLVRPRGSADIKQHFVPLAQAASPPPFIQTIRPDGSWGVAKKYPGLTLEIAHSQTSQGLINKIHQVLGYSKAYVRCCIGVKMRDDSLAASVELWRSGYLEGPDGQKDAHVYCVRQAEV